MMNMITSRNDILQKAVETYKAVYEKAADRYANKLHYDIAYTGIVAPGGEVIAKLDKPGTWQVVDIDMEKEVFTNTLVVPGRVENIRDYLHKCRNYKAFSSLAEEGTPPKEWDEIYRYNN